MMAPAGILLSSVIGGGDCLTLMLVTMPFKSSDVASGLGWNILCASCPTAGCVRRCFVRYDADRGSDGRTLLVWPWKEDLRLISGETGADEAGDRREGGVYGIPLAVNSAQMSAKSACWR